MNSAQKNLIVLAGALLSSQGRGEPPMPPFPEGAMHPAPLPIVPFRAVLAPSTTSASAARIQFQNATFDFGNVKSTDIVRHDFIFTNSGQATLEVTTVHPSCGCTTARDWTHNVEPGKTGTIPIQFSPVNFSGALAKSITVTCNDPTQPNIYLQIKGSVWKAMEVNPAYAYFTLIEGGETNQTKIARITNNTSEPVEVSPPEWNDKTFKAEVKTIKPNKEWEVHISLVPPVESSRAVTPIKLKTTSPEMPVITINAYAMVQSSVQVVPRQIVLPAGRLSANKPSTVIVRALGTKPLKLTEPAVDAESVTVNMVETEPGRVFQLDVTFPGGFQIERSKSLLLSVKSDSTSMPLIRVPIVQVVAYPPLPHLQKAPDPAAAPPAR